MCTLTLDLPEDLDTALTESAKLEGAESREAFLLRLIEERYEKLKLERVLLKRSEGPFTPFEPDWKEMVRQRARELSPQ